MADPRPRPAASRLYLAASLVFVAFNLRPALSSLGPVLPEALRGSGLTPAWSGLVTTLPILCLGLFGLAAPRFARVLGLERAVLALVAVLTAGLALRGLGQAAPLVIGCALGGVGIGVVNVLLPALVKRDFADRVPLMTGLYTMALCAGAAAGAGATAPIQRALGGDWAIALASWALPALGALLIWAPIALRPERQPGPSAAGGGLWRDPLAWQVTFFTGLQSSLAYSVMAWLAPILRDRGLSAVDAGLVVSASILVQVPAALFAPALSVKGRDQRAAVLATVGLSVVGMAGCMAAPLSTVWLWAAVLGLGQGSAFAVALTIIVLRSPDAATAARLSSMAQGVGYSVASIGPLGMGLLIGATQGRAWPLALFAALGAGAATAGWGAARSRHVRPRPLPPKGSSVA